MKGAGVPVPGGGVPETGAGVAVTGAADDSGTRVTTSSDGDTNGALEEPGTSVRSSAGEAPAGASL